MALVHRADGATAPTDKEKEKVNIHERVKWLMMLRAEVIHQLTAVANVRATIETEAIVAQYVTAAVVSELTDKMEEKNEK